MEVSEATEYAIDLNPQKFQNVNSVGDFLSWLSSLKSNQQLNGKFELLKQGEAVTRTVRFLDTPSAKFAQQRIALKLRTWLKDGKDPRSDLTVYASTDGDKNVATGWLKTLLPSNLNDWPKQDIRQRLDKIINGNGSMFWRSSLTFKGPHWNKHFYEDDFNKMLNTTDKLRKITADTVTKALGASNEQLAVKSDEVYKSQEDVKMKIAGHKVKADVTLRYQNSQVPQAEPIGVSLQWRLKDEQVADKAVNETSGILMNLLTTSEWTV